MMGKISAEETDDVQDVRMMMPHDCDGTDDMHALIRWKKLTDLVYICYSSRAIRISI